MTEQSGHELDMCMLAAIAICDVSYRTIEEGAGPVAAPARHLAIYLLHTSFQWPARRIADQFCKSPATVERALRSVEDMRDDAGFDLHLERIEELLARRRANKATAEHAVAATT